MAGVVRQQRILLETPNAKLEALVFQEPSRAGGAAAVILHPYALLGGSMHDHMCIELFRAAAACPAFSLVIRYNQRGVGRSSGSKNVRGRADMADVLDVVEFAAAQLPGPDKQVAVIGYSWGCCVAAYALSHPAVMAYVGVSPPLGGLSWVLQTKKHFGEVCRASHLPRLLLLGAEDQFTADSALVQLVHEQGGCLLRQDDSFQPDVDATSAAAAAAAAAAAEGAAEAAAAGGGGGGAAPPAMLPGAERMDLLLRIFPAEDHFWMVHGSAAAEYAVQWLGFVHRWLQQRRAAALVTPPPSVPVSPEQAAAPGSAPADAAAPAAARALDLSSAPAAAALAELGAAAAQQLPAMAPSELGAAAAAEGEPPAVPAVPHAGMAAAEDGPGMAPQAGGAAGGLAAAPPSTTPAGTALPEPHGTAVGGSSDARDASGQPGS